MGVLFQIIDPLQRNIVCTDECWKEHVLSQRSWMEFWVDDVKLALENPAYICSAADNDKREVYYYIPAPMGKYLRVVVQFDDEKGEVITAYPTDSGKPGETMIWPTSSN